MVTYTFSLKKIQTTNKYERTLYRFTLEMPHQTPSTKMAQNKKYSPLVFVGLQMGWKILLSQLSDLASFGWLKTDCILQII